jgi:hypothetical protein
MNDTKQQRGRSFSSRGVVLVFFLCLCVHWPISLARCFIVYGRSVIESAISAILGLVGTGWYLLAMWSPSHNDQTN